jgi:hypothetical protein
LKITNFEVPSLTSITNTNA